VTPRLRKIVRYLAFGFAVALVALLSGLVPFRADFLKGPIARAVFDETGLELSIGEPLIVRFGAWPGVITGGLRYASTEGATLLDVASLEGRLGLWPLLSGRLHLSDVRARDLRLDYCGPLPRFRQGEGSDTAPLKVVVHAVEIVDVHLVCGQTTSQDEAEIVFDRVSGIAPEQEDVRIEADARVLGEDVAISVVGGPLNNMLAGDYPYPVDIGIESDQFDAAFATRITLPVEIEAEIVTEVANLKSMLELLGVEIPPVGALAFNGTVRADLERISAESVSGALGDSRFELDAALDVGGERPRARVDVLFDNLDLVPFLADRQADSVGRRSGGLPDVDFAPVIDRLAAFDTNAGVRVRRVNGLAVELADIDIAGSLDAGVLELQSVSAAIPGGRLSGSGRLDSRSECPALNLAMNADGIRFDTINAFLAEGKQIGGGAGRVSVEVSSCGTRLYEHRDSLAATFSLEGGSLTYNDKPFPLTADNLDVAVAPGRRMSAGLAGLLADMPVKLELRAGTPESFWSGADWPVDLVLKGSGSELAVQAMGDFRPGDPLLEVDVKLDVPRVGTLHGWTGIRPEAEAPVQAETHMRLDSAALTAADVTVSAGASRLRGKVVWPYANDLAPVDISLVSGSLDVDQIVSFFPGGEPDPASAEEAWEPDPVLPAIDLDIRVDDVHAGTLDLQDVRLRGRLREGLIDDASVSLLVEEDIRLQGELDFDLRTLPAEGSVHVEAENLDIGLLASRLGLERSLSMRADGVEVDIYAKGNSLRQLLTESLIEAELLGYSWQVPKYMPGDDDVAAEAFEFDLDLLTVTTAPDRPTNWMSTGQIAGVQVDLSMQTPSLVDSFANNGALPARLVVAANDNVAVLETVIDLTTEEVLAGTATLSGAVIPRAGRVLEQIEAPLADYEISASVAASKRQLEFSDLRMRLGDSSVSGQVTIIGGARRKIDVALEAPRLQTEDLLYFSREFREALRRPDLSAIETSTDPGVEPIEAPVSSRRRGVLAMAGDFISTLQSRNDVNASVGIDELYSGESRLGSASLELLVSEDEFRLKPVKIMLPGGGVDAGYVVRIVNGQMNAELTVVADSLVYGGLLRLADPESEARGLLSVDTDISASTQMVPGKAPLELLFENASGYFRLAAWPENIEAGVLDLWSANVIVALLPTPEGRDISRLNCLVTKFDIQDGVMASTTSLLDTTDTIIRGRGTIDLGQEQLDLLVWPQAKREKFLSVSTPITVTGTFDDFSVGVMPAGFIGTAIRWYTSLIYVPFKWLTGERFAADGTATCFDAMGWELTPELQDYFQRGDFTNPPVIN
jgi:uncharacterized protein involved in outer membrane biogenesis